jgi:WD40 repeat protein
VAVFETDSYAVAEQHRRRSGRTHVYDAATQKTLRDVESADGGHEVPALSARGDLVALAGNTGVRIVDVASGKEIRTWSVESQGWLELFFAPGDKRLFGVDGNNPSRIVAWEAETGKVLWQHRGLYPRISDEQLAISADGSRLAYSLAGALRVVDAATGADLTGPPGLYGLESAALSQDGDLAATRSMGWVTFWNAKTCAVVKAVRNESDWAGYTGDLEFIAGTREVLMMEGDRHLARIAPDGTVRTADIASLRHNDAHTISRDGKTLVFGIEDEKSQAQLAVWDLDTMREVRRVPVPKKRMVEKVLFTPDQRTWMVTSPGRHDGGDMVGGPRSAFEIDVANGTVTSAFTIDVNTQGTTALVFGGGDLFALNKLVVRRSTKREERPLENDVERVSSDGRLAVMAGRRGSFVWRLDEAPPAAPREIRHDGLFVDGALDRTILACRRGVACDVFASP